MSNAKNVRSTGNVWFRRFRDECLRSFPSLRFKKIKYGFYRIYFRGAYIGECFDTMPPKGYDIEEDDIGMISQRYYEEYEDKAKLTRKIKNFVEGYYDLRAQFKTRIYMLKNDQEFRKTSQDAYKTLYVR